MNRSWIVAAFLLGCTSKRTFEMEWAFTSTGTCKDIGQQEITLHYVKAPNHFVVLCSDKLAAALKSGGKSVVPMVERKNGDYARSTSICSIDGIVDDEGSSKCSFRGQVLAGTNAPERGPWD